MAALVVFMWLDADVHSDNGAGFDMTDADKFFTLSAANSA